MYTGHKQTLDNAEAIQTIFSILKEGHSVELPATGLSMFPAIRPGERVVVRPFAKDEKPERGEVVVVYEKGAGKEESATAQSSFANATEDKGRSGTKAEEQTGKFVIHRLIEIKEDDSGNTLFITRGDSLKWVDKPWQIDQLVGIAVSKKSGNRERKIRSFVPSGLRYRTNRFMLWGWGKLVSSAGWRIGFRKKISIFVI